MKHLHISDSLFQGNRIAETYHWPPLLKMTSKGLRLCCDLHFGSYIFWYQCGYVVSSPSSQHMLLHVPLSSRAPPHLDHSAFSLTLGFPSSLSHLFSPHISTDAWSHASLAPHSFIPPRALTLAVTSSQLCPWLMARAAFLSAAPGQSTAAP